MHAVEVSRVGEGKVRGKIRSLIFALGKEG